MHHGAEERRRRGLEGGRGSRRDRVRGWKGGEYRSDRPRGATLSIAKALTFPAPSSAPPHTRSSFPPPSPDPSLLPAAPSATREPPSALAGISTYSGPGILFRQPPGSRAAASTLPLSPGGSRGSDPVFGADESGEGTPSGLRRNAGDGACPLKTERASLSDLPASRRRGASSRQQRFRPWCTLSFSDRERRPCVFVRALHASRLTLQQPKCLRGRHTRRCRCPAASSHQWCRACWYCLVQPRQEHPTTHGQLRTRQPLAAPNTTAEPCSSTSRALGAQLTSCSAAASRATAPTPPPPSPPTHRLPTRSPILSRREAIRLHPGCRCHVGEPTRPAEQARSAQAAQGPSRFQPCFA